MKKSKPIRKLLLPIMLIGVLILTSFRYFDHSNDSVNRSSYSFSNGEKLEFRIHYGLINAGEAIMQIDNEPAMINGKSCYKIDVFGRSTGMFDFLIRVRDNWGTYLDTEEYVPHRFYRYIEEGKYRKNEIVDFDHEQNKAIVSRLGKTTKTLKKKVEFEIPTNCQDLVSGYYYLRTIDYTKINVGDTINVQGFFDDDTWNMNVRFMGRETLKTKIGKIKSLVFAPIMPENTMFDGEDSIKYWLSDDENKIPLKIKAQMFIGSLEVDIKNAENLQYNFSSLGD